MELFEARYLAEKIVKKLVPVTEKVMICGSIRRHKPEVTDIDLCVIPKRRPIKDLFGMVTKHVPTEEFCNLIDSWEKLKGEATGKYTQRLIEKTKVEISICTVETFWPIALIRTGNSDFTHMMMIRANKCGLEQRDGLLYRDGRHIPIHSEEEYFRILDLPFVTPDLRDKDAFKRVKA